MKVTLRDGCLGNRTTRATTRRVSHFRWDLSSPDPGDRRGYRHKCNLAGRTVLGVDVSPLAVQQAPAKGLAVSSLQRTATFVCLPLTRAFSRLEDLTIGVGKKAAIYFCIVSL